MANTSEKPLLTDRDFRAVAPNVADRMYLFRPTPGFADPPLCELHQLRTVYTLNDLANFHEILELRGVILDKAKARVEQQREAKNRRGRR
ncbi:conserved protein of unknown function [Methylorubrum extorquens]|uniref:Uncharacterized protein n=1 Tax=Methylorubrum extorquens TaxID=408 RepID=A0A2N9ASY5_METEX|nr:conserved protein of unknown function [Methylorubrum extorquens]